MVTFVCDGGPVKSVPPQKTAILIEASFLSSPPCTLIKPAIEMSEYPGEPDVNGSDLVFRLLDRHRVESIAETIRIKSDIHSLMSGELLRWRATCVEAGLMW